MLSPLRIAWDNLLDLTAAVVTASSAAASFPASQVQSKFRALRWRSTAITSQWIKVDFGATKDWNTVILWDHNLTTSATVTITGSADDITYSSTLQAGVPMVDGQLVIDCGDRQYRYIKITIVDGSNPDGYFEVGKVFVGAYLEADYHDNYGRSVTPVSRSIRTESSNGVTHVIVRPQFNRIGVTFERIPRAMRDEFLAFVAAVDTWMQFWLMLDPDTAIDADTYYVTLEALPPFALVDCDQHNFGLSFCEVT